MASVGCATARSQRRADPRNPHRSPRTASRVDAAARYFAGAAAKRSSRRRIIGFLTHHGGVDFVAIAGVAARRASSEDVARGASTITMQLAAMLDPTLAPQRASSRASCRRLAQMRAALALERRWSKDEILESLSEPGHLARRAAGNRRRVARDVRQGAARNQSRRGGRAGGIVARAQCAIASRSSSAR